jgi:hypothetical protein
MTAYDLYELGKWGYDKYQRSQQPAAPAPDQQMPPEYFSVDRQIREEAARRALGQQ